jgi:hypothetical protein
MRVEMRGNRKGQIALEFIIVYSVVLIIFVLVFAVVSGQRAEILNAQQASIARIEAQEIAAYINHAISAGSGYTTTLSLAQGPGSVPYSVYVSSSGAVIINSTSASEPVSAFAFSDARNLSINGSLQYSANGIGIYLVPSYTGVIKISNVGGTVYIDRPPLSNAGLLGSSILSNVQENYAANFNSSGTKNSLVYIADSNALRLSAASINYTILAWIRRVNPGQPQEILSKGNTIVGGYQIGIGTGSCTTNQINVSKLGVASLCMGTVPYDNGWHQIGIVYTSTGTSAYVDGSLSGSSANGNPITASTNAPLKIGVGIANDFFTGQISNIQIYNGSFNSNQINQSYSVGPLGAPVFQKKLVGWWPLSGNGNDYSGNGQSGQYINITFQTMARLSMTLLARNGTALANVPVGVVVSGSIAGSALHGKSTNGAFNAVVLYNTTNQNASVYTFGGNISTTSNLIGWWPLTFGDLGYNTIYDISNGNDNGIGVYLTNGMGGNLGTASNTLVFTITNNQATNSPNPFQQMLSYTSGAYASYEANDLGNVRFFAANGVALDSWCESSCTSGTYTYELSSAVISQNALGVNYTYIKVSNNQATATNNPFQQMITFPTKSFGSYEANDLGNVRFFVGTNAPTVANELYSWCEIGCNSINNFTSPNAIFWVKLTNSIPANGNTVLNLTFQPIATEYDGNVAGECALCSVTGNVVLYSLPTNSPSANSVATQTAQTVYEGDQNSYTSPTGNGEADVSASDDGAAPIYLCAGSIDSEGGADTIGGTSWNWDWGYSYTSTGWQSGNNNCQETYGDGGNNEGSVAVVGVTSSSGWTNSGDTQSGGGLASVSWTPSGPNEFDVVLNACGDGQCNYASLPDGCIQIIQQSGSLGDQATIFTCTGLPQTLQTGSVSGGDEATIEVFQFPEGGSISTTDTGGFSNYVCVLGNSGNEDTSSFSADLLTAGDQIGTQTSTPCTASFDSGNAALASIGVNKYTTMTIGNNTSSNTISYTVTLANSLAILALACGSGYTCSNIYAPTGCKQVQNAYYDSGENAIIYSCQNQALGTYSLSTGAGETSAMAYYLFTSTTNSLVGYAKYDNGGNIFNLYDNFNGVTINSVLWGASSGDTVNDGVTLSVSGGGGGLITASAKAWSVGNTMVDWDGYVNVSAGSNAGSYLAPVSNNNAQQWLLKDGAECGAGFYWQEGYNLGATCSKIGTLSSSSPNVFSMGGKANTGNYLAMVNYGRTYSNTIALAYSPGVSATFTLNSYGPLDFMQWWRTRVTPPNGIMPSVAFNTPTMGNVVYPNNAPSVFWVKLTNSIPANGNMIVNLTFQSTSTEFDGVVAGECPTCSSTYSKYDNGNNVFAFYQSGATNTVWTTGAGIGGETGSAPAGSPFGTNALYASGADRSDYITTNTMLATNGNWIIQYYVYGTIDDFYLFANSVGTGMMSRMEGRGFAGSGFGVTLCYTSNGYMGVSCWHSPNGAPILTASTWYMFQVDVLGANTAGDWESSTLNYEPTTLTNINPLSTTFTELDGPSPGVVSNSIRGSYFTLRGDTINNPSYINGLMVRSYPPNGIMPSATSFLEPYGYTGNLPLGGNIIPSNSVVLWNPWTLVRHFGAVYFPGNSVQTSYSQYGIVTVNAVGSLQNVTTRNNLTEVAWIKWNGGSQQKCAGIFGSGGIGGGGIQLQAKNKNSNCGILYIGGNNLTGNYLTPLSSLNWTMVSVTFNGKAGTAYVFENKSVVYSNNGVGGYSIAPSNSLYYFGAENSLGGNTFNGLISDVQIYSQSLSAPQIAQLYSEGPTGLPILGSGLSGWWPLAGNATDYSGGNKGTLTYNAIFTAANYTFSYNTTRPSRTATFNGVDGMKIAGGGGIPFNGVFSVSLWFSSYNSPSTSFDYELLDGQYPNQNAFDVQLCGAGDCPGGVTGIHSNVGTGSATLSNTVNYQFPFVTRRPYNLVETFSTTGWAIYVNGANVSSGAYTTNGVPKIAGTSDYLVIGGGAFPGSYFNGQIADVQIYNSILTPSQARQIYQQGISHQNGVGLSEG